jgi:conserved oligomeric Golgi complex subunit 1
MLTPDSSQVERQIRADIDNKKVQVRQLVGDSYHELISSADLILKMADSATAVAADINHVRSAFTQLERSLSHDDSNQNQQGRHMSGQQLELYGALQPAPQPFAVSLE